MKKFMRNIFNIVLTMILSTVLTLSGCNNKEEIKNTEAHTEEEHHENEVALTDEQIRLMGIEFSKVDSQNISGYIKVNGEIMMDQDNESNVGSIIPGRVKKIYVKEGSFVRAGQTLAIIENPDLINAQVEYLEAKHEYEHAETEYERQKKLASNEIGSKKDLAKLKADYEHAIIGLKSAEQRLMTYKISVSGLENYEDIADHSELQRYFPVSAPISGNVVSRKVTAGQYVEPSTDMFHIVNTSSLYVDLSIFEKDLRYVNIGQKVEITTSSDPDESYSGKVSVINKIFDDKNRTVKVRVLVSNKSQQLYPFMFVTGKIYVNDGRVLAVPVASIESEGHNKFIFVKTDERKKIESHEEHSEKEQKEGDEHKESEQHSDEEGILFKKIQVSTGISDDRFVEIIPFEKLDENAEVVSKGTFYFKSEMKREELGGHEH